MKPLRLEEVWRLLPPLDELQPVLDLLASRSAPDPRHAWAGSGELDTVGERVVPAEAMVDADQLAARMHDHLVRVYGGIADCVRRLSRGDRAGAAHALLEVADTEQAAGRSDRAAAYAGAAHGLARDLRDRRPASLALRRWGRALRAGGALEEALGRYVEALEISEALRDPRDAAEAAVGAGNVLEDQGRWPEAEARYRQALDLLDQAHEGPVAERWHALLNLHIVLRSQGRLSESAPFLDEAARVAGELEDPDARVFLENARGQLEMVLGGPGAAEEHFRTALAAATSPAARIVVGVNLAEALMAQGRRMDATEVARQAELEAVSSATLPRLPEVYRLLGRIASADDNPETFVLFERALELIREHGLPRVEEARTLQAYGEAEAHRGETEVARTLLDRAAVIYRDLGIQHTRHPWAEYHPSSPAPPSNDLPESDGDDDD
jgi:tetratricopeptide (TPR) repeat protein